MAASDSREGQPPNNGSRVIIWCVPRSISTALTKCLSFIDGMQVWFAPYVYCRVARLNLKQQLSLDLPYEYQGNEEIYKRMVDHFIETAQAGTCTNAEYLCYASICRFLEQSTSSHVLVKDMAYAVSPEEYKYIPKGFKHIFLFRHPLRVYTSFRKASFGQLSALGLLTGEAAVEETFNIQRDYQYANKHDNGVDLQLFKDLYNIWKYVQEDLSAESIVVDADDLVTNPAEMLPKICRAVGLPYDESLLKWDASPEVTKKWMVPTEGLVEQLVYFYNTAINSSEFIKPRKMPSREEASSDVIECTDLARKYYEEMYEVRLKV